MNSEATTLNLASIISHHARLAPDKEAVIWEDVRLTFGELEKASNRVAGALVEMGIGYGDKVARCCPNLPDFPIVYYGIMKAGAVVVPLSVLFKAREISYHLSDSDAKAVFVFEGTDDLPMAKNVSEGFAQVAGCLDMIILTKVGDAAGHPLGRTLTEITTGMSDEFSMYPTAPDDTCLILYTSGTTGQPKGAELSHGNLMSNVTTTWLTHLPVLDFTDMEQKTCLITLPLFHTTGQTVQMNANLYGGNRVVLLPRFDARTALDTMVREKVNFWVGVPTMYWALIKHVEETGYDVSGISENMKVCTSGGAPMPVQVMHDFQELFGVRVMEGYGLSETSPLATFNHFEKPSRPGTVGQPIFGVEIMCVDETDAEVERGERGEIVIRGPNVMKGYYKRPEATAEAFRNGWFHTGDIGIMDNDGYLSIVDRKKDMILRGGYNIYPRELEEVIITHPAISICAVIGVPCERLGEEVKAFVVLKQGYELTVEEFVAWCKTQFAANKYPRHVEFRAELPVGGTGKIFKELFVREIGWQLAQSCRLIVTDVSYKTHSDLTRCRFCASSVCFENPPRRYSIAASKAYEASLFTQHCAICHGPEGDGRTLDDGTKVPSLREGDLKFKTEAEIYRQISDGGNGMAPFRDQLTDRELKLMTGLVHNDLRSNNK